MCRAGLLVAALVGLSSGLAGEDKPPTAEQKKRVEELRKQIAEKRAEVEALEAELTRLTSEKGAALNEWVQAGDVRVRVTKAKVQKVPLVLGTKGKEKFESDGPELMLWVEIENLSKAKKVTYFRWRTGPLRGPWAKLTDDHKNEYRLIPRGELLGVHVDGGSEHSTTTMAPGAPVIRDILCFEPPVGAAKELTLILNRLQDEEKGEYRFKIPASVWTGDKK
jgi:hypothetical protein